MEYQCRVKNFQKTSEDFNCVFGNKNVNLIYTKPLNLIQSN
jgi:hypothetical protein